MKKTKYQIGDIVQISAERRTYAGKIDIIDSYVNGRYVLRNIPFTYRAYELTKVIYVNDQIGFMDYEIYTILKILNDLIKKQKRGRGR